MGSVSGGGNRILLNYIRPEQKTKSAEAPPVEQGESNRRVSEQVAKKLYSISVYGDDPPPAADNQNISQTGAPRPYIPPDCYGNPEAPSAISQTGAPTPPSLLELYPNCLRPPAAADQDITPASETAPPSAVNPNTEALTSELSEDEIKDVENFLEPYKTELDSAGKAIVAEIRKKEDHREAPLKAFLSHPGFNQFDLAQKTQLLSAIAKTDQSSLGDGNFSDLLSLQKYFPSAEGDRNVLLAEYRNGETYLSFMASNNSRVQRNAATKDMDEVLKGIKIKNRSSLYETKHFSRMQKLGIVGLSGVDKDKNWPGIYVDNILSSETKTQSLCSLIDGVGFQTLTSEQQKHVLEMFVRGNQKDQAAWNALTNMPMLEATGNAEEWRLVSALVVRDETGYTLLDRLYNRPNMSSSLQTENIPIPGTNKATSSSQSVNSAINPPLSSEKPDPTDFLFLTGEAWGELTKKANIANGARVFSGANTLYELVKARNDLYEVGRITSGFSGGMAGGWAGGALFVAASTPPGALAAAGIAVVSFLGGVVGEKLYTSILSKDKIKEDMKEIKTTIEIINEELKKHNEASVITPKSSAEDIDRAWAIQPGGALLLELKTQYEFLLKEYEALQNFYAAKKDWQNNPEQMTRTYKAKGQNPWEVSRNQVEEYDKLIDNSLHEINERKNRISVLLTPE